MYVRKRRLNNQTEHPLTPDTLPYTYVRKYQIKYPNSHNYTRSGNYKAPELELTPVIEEAHGPEPDVQDVESDSDTITPSRASIPMFDHVLETEEGRTVTLIIK